MLTSVLSLNYGGCNVIQYMLTHRYWALPVDGCKMIQYVLIHRYWALPVDGCNMIQYMLIHRYWPLPVDGCNMIHCMLTHWYWTLPVDGCNMISRNVGIFQTDVAVSRLRRRYCPLLRPRRPENSPVKLLAVSLRLMQRAFLVVFIDIYMS
jgi:hypothetical protein